MPFSRIGIITGAAFFSASFLPSLLPRSWLKQGTITAATLVIGYAFGALVGVVVARFRPGVGGPPPRWGLAVPGATAALFVVLGVRWENAVRRAVEADAIPAWEPLAAVAFAVTLAVLLVMGARLATRLSQGLTAWLGRYLGRRAATVSGMSVALVIVVGLVQGVMVNGTLAVIASTYTALNEETSAWISQPDSPSRSGSPGSLVPWETLGRYGREFTGSGPTAAEISGLRGRATLEPVRVYVGIDSAPTLEDRVALLLAEIDRMSALQRGHVAIVTATGTGWVDEAAVEAFEFLHAGDTTTIVMQYSRIPSWVLYFGDRTIAAETTSAVWEAVDGLLGTMPEEERPHLAMVGESLGALGVVLAFDDARDLLERTDSALLIGPPRADPIRAGLLAARDPASPPWRPTIPAWPEVRFAVGPDDLIGEDIDVVYLQYASDAVGYTSFDLILRRPDWFDTPRGPDVTAAMVWLPVVSFWQSLGDIGFAQDVPEGHGHNYGADIVNAWVALDAPADWTNADTERLRAVIRARAEARETRSSD